MFITLCIFPDWHLHYLSDPEWSRRRAKAVEAMGATNASFQRFRRINIFLLPVGKLCDKAVSDLSSSTTVLFLRNREIRSGSPTLIDAQHGHGAVQNVHQD